MQYLLDIFDRLHLRDGRAHLAAVRSETNQPMDNTLPSMHRIRSLRVMLDSDLARLYGVSTSRLNEAVKRNVDRFPEDFRFQITPEEYTRLISQFAISKSERADEHEDDFNSSPFVISSRQGRGGLRKMPWAFTEHGVLMAATVLKSSRAVQMSLFVVRAFVQMREEILGHSTVFKRLAELDKKRVTHDVILREVYEKLRPLLNPPPVTRKKMGVSYADQESQGVRFATRSEATLGFSGNNFNRVTERSDSSHGRE